MKTPPITPHLKSLHRATYLLATITLGFLLGVFSPAMAVNYSFTTIDVPGAVETNAFGINNSGQIVGEFTASSRAHGFLLSGGAFTTIDVPGAINTQAFGINDSGQIAGESDSSHGFLLSGGAFTTIDVPGATLTQAFKINNSGQIAGRFQAGTTVFHGFLATPDCTNQVTVNAFTALTTTGLDATIVGNTLTLLTSRGLTNGIAFQASVSIAQGLAPIPGIHIKYIQNVTQWTGAWVYQPKPDRLASLMGGTTLPLLDRLAAPPPPFYDGLFNETNPSGPDRIVTAEDSPEILTTITRTGPDRQLQSVNVTNAFTMFLGCTIGTDQTFRTLSTMDWIVQYTGTLNPGPPPTFTPGADAGITAQPSIPDGGTPVQVAPIFNDVLTFVDGPP